MIKTTQAENPSLPKDAKPGIALSDPEHWVDEHGDYLFKFAPSRLRDPAKAEDAMQETFLAALEGANGFASLPRNKLVRQTGVNSFPKCVKFWQMHRPTDAAMCRLRLGNESF